jgi:hypothetical protein
MSDRTTHSGSISEQGFDNPEAALGGADAVEKTTYVTGRGTEPETRTDGPTARVSSGRVMSTPWVVIISLFVAAVLVYLLGYGR